METEARIAEIRERRAKITSPPWKAYHRVSPRGAHKQWHIGNEDGLCQITMGGYERDYDFIANAPDDISFLLSALASARGDLSVAHHKENWLWCERCQAWIETQHVCGAQYIDKGTHFEPVKPASDEVEGLNQELGKAAGSQPTHVA